MKNYIGNEGYKNQNIFESANGPYLNLYNKKIIDLGCCSGANIIGHNLNIHKKIFKNIIKKNISNISSPNTQNLIFGETLKKILPYFSKFIMCNSGGESIIKAIRIARAVSKKDMVVSATGSWHGSVDQFLYGTDQKLNKLALSDGLSKIDEKRLILIPYNNIKESKKILFKNKKKISCIIVEPIQGCLPLASAKKYLKFLEKFANQNKILLIFDEMITGFRTNGQTVQSIFKIKTDISTFGKCYGGGVPLGFIGINKKIANMIESKKISVYFGGTFSGNSQNMFYSNEIINYILKNKNKIFKKINNNTKLIEQSVNKFCEKKSIDVKIYRFYSMFRLVFSSKLINNRTIRDFLEKDKNKLISAFKRYMLKKNIYYPNNGIAFVSSSLNKKHILYIIKSIQSGLEKYFK